MEMSDWLILQRFTRNALALRLGLSSENEDDILL
jgi:hypothetical protein